MSQWKKGTVDWFDSLSGEGFIKSKTGELYYVHYSAIESERANKKRKNLKKNAEVEFLLHEEPTLTQVAKVRES